MDAIVRTITDEQNIVTVVLDLPGKPVNTCSPQLLADLNQALDAIEKSRPAGVIFASAKARSFNAGADLFEIRKMNREEVAAYLALGQSIFNRIANLPMPTVAAINGDCMGGGYELALACTYRVASDNTSINIGLPETKLGLIPAWGGTTRLPRLIGLTRALPILLGGLTMPPRKALKAGLIDEVVRPEALLSAARRLLSSGKGRRKPGRFDGVVASLPALRNKVLAKAEASTRKLTYDNYPAPIKLLEAIRIGYEQGLPAGFEAERKFLVELADTEPTRNLMRLFFLKQGSKKWTSDALNSAKPREVKHVAVIGGGTMGSGIVHVLIRAGYQVRLIELDANALSAGLGRVKKLLDEDVAGGRMDKLAARHAFNRIAPTTEYSGLGLVDLVIEAVVEKLDVKHQVFAHLDRLCKPDCVLATNTSSLPVTEIAKATIRPSRVVGMHFFNPVKKMPLVEIVRGEASDDVSLATAAMVGAKIGKTPIITGDSPGFVVNRVLIPYLREAILMATEGTPILDIDETMKKWGMPMGPFELLDEIGLDVAVYVLKSLARTPEEQHIPPAIQAALDKGWLGKKSGKGFYIHAKPTKRKKAKELVLNEELAALFRPTQPRAATGVEEIPYRLVLPMINEAAKVLEDRVIDSSDALDLTTVLGLGLAPFRGGLIHYANSLGTPEIVRRLEELTVRLDLRFVPAELLKRLAMMKKPIELEPTERPKRNESTVAVER